MLCGTPVMASWFGAFRIWFMSQPLSIKRSAILERLNVLFLDPLTEDVVRACPPAVQDAFDAFKTAVRSSDWTVRQ